MLLKLDGVDEATVAAKSKLLTACKEALNAIREYSMMGLVCFYFFYI